MKRFYQIVSSSFIVIGSVIGAGFISGRRSSAFFGSHADPVRLHGRADFFLIHHDFVPYRRTIRGGDAGKPCGLREILPAAGRSDSFSCMISVCSMLAGLDALTESFLHKIPVLSVVCLLVSTFCLRRGIRGIAAVNLIMVPFMIVIVVFFLLKKGNFLFCRRRSAERRILKLFCMPQ